MHVPSTVTGTQILFTQPYQSSASPYPVSIALVAGSPASFTVQVDTSSGSIAAHPAAVLGANNHVVLTWTGTALTAYVDGVAASGGTGTAPITNYASPYTGFTVGGPSDPKTGFSGSVGEVALYTTALSATRVKAHYNAAIDADPTPPPATGYAGTVQSDHPVVYYRMNETSGTSAVDSSGHGYNGTYGSSVTLGGTGLVPGDAAPTFPGGTSSATTVLRSLTNAALGPTSGAMSAEWVKVPSTVSSGIPVHGTVPVGRVLLPDLHRTRGRLVALLRGGSQHEQRIDRRVSVCSAGSKNDVVLTWTGTTLTVYVNGVASSGGTGTAPITNYASPYTGFTVGGSTDAHTGYAGSIGEFALYNTALSAARVQAHYNAGLSSQGTVMWQTGGSGSTGDYFLLTSDGQCGSPVISGNNATFTSLRNTNTTYIYEGNSYPGASTCYRNQMNPSTSNGDNWLFTLGTSYTFTFQTIITLHGNYLYQGASDGGLAADIPAIVWQTHSTAVADSHATCSCYKTRTSDT